ncbi:MAG: ABC transporter ATP-binding protein [Myxococcota bacterium]|nr:ABC transporter ATP-binding protein [Myxococcota bacterium]
MNVEALRKNFTFEGETIPVLQGLDLTIYRGDMCSIVGQSGVGKSTLMHILGALDRPSSGRILFNGDDVFSRPDAELAQFRNRSMGFVFQFHHLLPELSAAENVALPRMIAREPKPHAVERAKALLEAVGLSHRLKHRPGELSGGEQQRVAIARALAMEPALVLADEPTGNLDQRTSDEIHELLVQINEERNIAFVIVTHNQALAEMMDRRLVMRDGVVYEGGP